MEEVDDARVIALRHAIDTIDNTGSYTRAETRTKDVLERAEEYHKFLVKQSTQVSNPEDLKVLDIIRQLRVIAIMNPEIDFSLKNMGLG